MSQAKEHRRQLWVIVTIVFLGFIGISMPYLIFPALFLNPNYFILPVETTISVRALYLGVTLAAYPLGQFIGSPILGALSDDYGRKQLLSGTLVIAGIGNLLTGYSIAHHNVILLILSRFIVGVMEGNIAIARAMAIDIKTISKHETLGKINAAISIAFLIGPLVGGVLTDSSILSGLNTSTPFFFICVLFFGLAVMSMIVLKSSVISTAIQRKSIWQRINFIKRISMLFSNKQLKTLLIVSTLCTLAVDIFYEFGPVFLTVKWTLGPSQLVLYNGILCLTLAIGNGWLPAIVSKRYNTRKVIVSMITGLVILLIAMIYTEYVWLMVVLFGLSGLCIGLSGTLLTVKISDAVSDAIQGEVMGTQLSLRVLGDGIICLGGAILLILSAKIILAIAALIALCAVIYYSIYEKDTDKQIV
ncbi:MAG: MFS transporter [Parachlamydiales bacterium]|nr:MFS transporter [Parachlamydiales bacterium]